MAKTINIDRIYSELDKADLDELWDAYQKINKFVENKILAAKKEWEEKIAEQDEKLKSLNGN